MLNQLKQTLKEAMRQKHIMDKLVLQGIISACDEARIRLQHELSDAEILDVIRKEHKLYLEAAEGALKAGREDLANEANFKARYAATFLPKQLTEEELISEMKTLLAEHDINSMNKGQLMKIVMPHFKGKADGKLINQVLSIVVK